jgi:hypothetical protein
MKRLFYIVCCLFLVMGCNDPSIKDELDTYEKGLETNPEATYQILKDAEPITQEDKARLALLTIKAKNLAYVPLEGKDTISVLDAIDYYQRKRNTEQVMLGYYLLGSIYRDLGDAPRGVEAFMKVTEAADTTKADCNYRLLARAEAQKSDMQRLQKVRPKAIESSYQAEYYSWKARDTTYAIQVAFETIGLHFLNGNKQPLIHQAPNLIQNCLERGDTSLAIYEAVGFAWDYLAIGMKDEAERMMQLYDRYDGTPYPIYYGTKGELYLARHQLDSAEWSFRKELEATDWNNRQTAYRGLKKVYEQRHQLDSALKYATLQCAAVDSDYDHKVSEYIIQMEHVYNYDAAKEKAQQSEMARQRTKLTLWMVVSVFIIVVLLTGFGFKNFHDFQQRKLLEQKTEEEKLKALLAEREKQLAQEESQRKAAESKAAQMEASLAEINADLEILRRERETLQQDIHTLKTSAENVNSFTQERIQELESMLKQKEQDIIGAEREMELQKEELLTQQEEMANMKVTIEELRKDAQLMGNLGDGVQQMKRCLKRNKHATKDEWTALQAQIIKLYPTFISSLQQRICPLTDKDLHLAMLIRMDFLPSEIAILMSLSASAVTMARRRLYQKAFGRSPMAPEDVDKWIMEVE